MMGIPGSEQVNPKTPTMRISEAAESINTRQPENSGNFEDLLGGEEMERGGASANRWPRQETLALIQIRSEMDAAFRDSTLKGPLWEEVSRKLAELGYTRTAKKCKEKFENIHKYYKRTKEGRIGRQDGKNYRFFSQLEALNNNATFPAPVTSVICASNAETTNQFNPETTVGSSIPPERGHSRVLSQLQFTSSSTESSSNSEEGEEVDRESGKKRKRSGSEGWGKKKMAAFLERLLKRLLDSQETMQKRFLEMIDKREHERIIQEEAWKREAMARINLNNEIIAQERAISASKHAAITNFLQKITGQTVHIPISTVSTHTPAPPPPPPQNMEVGIGEERALVVEQVEPDSNPDPISLPRLPDLPSSRWPKPEVLALIDLRSELEAKYLESGPKAPMWEEISSGMARLGYSRSAKRCKEKWENINKYYKKVKESNKKRPEDAKTCPYFHQLDELYRKKKLTIVSGSSFSGRDIEHGENLIKSNVIMPIPLQQINPVLRANSLNNVDGGGGGGGGGDSDISGDDGDSGRIKDTADN